MLEKPFRSLHTAAFEIRDGKIAGVVFKEGDGGFFPGHLAVHRVNSLCATGRRSHFVARFPERDVALSVWAASVGMQ